MFGAKKFEVGPFRAPFNQEPGLILQWLIVVSPPSGSFGNNTFALRFRLEQTCRLYRRAFLGLSTTSSNFPGLAEYALNKDKYKTNIEHLKLVHQDEKKKAERSKGTTDEEESKEEFVDDFNIAMIKQFSKICKGKV
jgi:hypothetical protein